MYQERGVQLPSTWAADWEIDGILGSGAFSTVYHAVRRDRRSITAAIKVIAIPGDNSGDDVMRSEGLNLSQSQSYYDDVARKYISEIELMEELKGMQHIVSIEDYKVVRKPSGIGNYIFIRMELLKPLDGVIRERMLTEAEVLKVGVDICRALEVCEARSIIHRDIKPANIFVNDKTPGHAFFKLGDFGVARSVDSLTHGLSQKGTPNYMAPEVFSGGSYDQRADIYSLGITLYRLLNRNRLPLMPEGNFSAGAREQAIVRRMSGEKLPPPSGASEAMGQAILKACEFRAEDRYASATEMRLALEAVAAGRTFSGVPMPAPEGPAANIPLQAAGMAPAGMPLQAGGRTVTGMPPQAGGRTVTGMPQQAGGRTVTGMPPQAGGRTVTGTFTQQPGRTANIPPQAAPRTPQTAQSEPEPPRKSGRSKTEIIAIAASAVLILIGIVIVILVMSGNRNGQENEPVVTAQAGMDEATPGTIQEETVAPVLTDSPTAVPTDAPTAVPTEAPTEVPTEAPTEVPTEAPTEVPTEAPTEVPTETPTTVPTETPTTVPTETPTSVPVQENGLPEITSVEWSDEEDTVVLTIRRNGAAGRMYISAYAGKATDQSYYAYGTPVIDPSDTIVYSMKNSRFVPGVTFVFYPQLDQGGGTMTDSEKVEFTIPIREKPGNSIGVYDFNVDDVSLEAITAVTERLRKIGDEQGMAGFEAAEKDEFDQAFSASVHVTGYVRALIMAPDGRISTNAISIGNAKDLKTVLGEAFLYHLTPQEGRYTVRLYDWGNKCLIGECSFNVVRGPAAPAEGYGLSVGEVVAFGHYEQDGNPENGKEPIEWIVLDVQDGKAMLISRYGLEVLPYNNEKNNVTWETCSLRTWLNSSFLNEAFSADQIDNILISAVDNSDAQGSSEWTTSGGNTTWDRIYLMSWAEAVRHFGATTEISDDSNIASRMAPTAHAGASAWISEKYQTADGEDTGFWWLRSPGMNQNNASVVLFAGNLYGRYDVDLDFVCVRPVLWVNMK